MQVSVLLSPDGVNHRSDPATINICVSCMKAIRSNKLPKFAIANGLWVGRLPPDLIDSTVAELAVVTPIRTVGRFAVFYGASRHNTGTEQHKLRGHVYSTLLDVSSVVSTLPLVPSETPVQVILCGRSHLISAIDCYAITRCVVIEFNHF